ncbi:MAG: zinc-binding dehydrogenase [Acidimicrobiales bacterium]|nr:zinc-binding dehydrogenase [Acidimicrobiales bacterium]
MRAVSFVDSIPTTTTLPDPEPSPSELLIEVASCGLNGADMLQATGNYPPPPGAPDTPGLEMAGTVVARGDRCRRFDVGDRVMAVVSGGGQAELCVVEEILAVPVARSHELGTIGGVPEVIATAHDALFTQSGLQMGERVCVHGAAGGVGSAAVQLAVAAGATVTATVRNPELRDAVADFGAEVIDPAEFVDAGPFDVILELVGAPNWPANIAALAVEGRISVIGVGAGSKVEINLVHLMGKRARIFASTLRARPLAQRAMVADRIERHVLPLLDSGAIQIPVAARFELSDVAAAYERFKAGGKFGKVIINP